MHTFDLLRGDTGREVTLDDEALDCAAEELLNEMIARNDWQDYLLDGYLSISDEDAESVIALHDLDENEWRDTMLTRISVYMEERVIERAEDNYLRGDL